MNSNATENETAGIDRFPAADPQAPQAVQACRAEIAQRKGGLPGPYGLLVHSPQLAHAFEALSGALWQGDVPRRVMEGLFLLNAWHHRCRYQWVRHVDKAREAGLAQAVIERLAAGAEPERGADPAFHAAWQLATVLQQAGAVSDALLAQLRLQFGTSKAIAELTAFCGFASLVSNALRVRQPVLPADSGPAPF